MDEKKRQGHAFPSKFNKGLPSESGFTLVELLTVIAIITLITSVALLQMNNSRLKARESRRKSDVALIRKALEIYYHDDNHGQYPNGGAVKKEGKDYGIQNLKSFLVPKYLNFMPDDTKKDIANYQYVWGNNGQDYGIFVPFSNDGGQDCMFKTSGGDPAWFRQGSKTVPDCKYYQ